MTELPEEYLKSDFDFGFTSVDEDELNGILTAAGAVTTPDEILNIKDKLDLILQMNATCDGANQVKEQYDTLMKAKLDEIEKVILPLLVNLKKNKDKDYIYWPGGEREAKCDLQIQKILSITRD